MMPERPDAPLTVALDGTPLLGVPTGIGVFTSDLLEALASRGDLSVSSFAVSWRRREQLADAVPDGVRTDQGAMPARPLTWLWSHSNVLAAERFIGPVDVVHGTNFTVPPTRRAGRVVTVHDLTCVRYPELCQSDTLRYPALIARAIKGGAIVHTPSAFVADEVREHFRVKRDQVVPVHSGIPVLPEPDREAAAAIIDPGRPYVLSIGTAEPRKDLPGLVAAFDAAAAIDPELTLVLVGPPGWGSAAVDEAIENATARSRIVTAGFVSDGALSALLSGARLLAYPSVYEGFGFPPLQAMARGIPVVTTAVGSLKEIAGGAAAFVPVGDVDALAEQLVELSSDEARRSILITAGLARANDFTWEATATGLVNLYRRSRQR